jgi:hypothetical protein
MSGGRATVRGLTVRQCGDIAAVAEEGNGFCAKYYVECKHLKSLDWSGLINGKGMLAKYWLDTDKKANVRGLDPMLIARQNRGPIIVCLDQNVGVLPMMVVCFSNAQEASIAYVYRLKDLCRTSFTSLMTGSRNHAAFPRRRTALTR